LVSNLKIFLKYNTKIRIIMDNQPIPEEEELDDDMGFDSEE
jgi:hypothetical protein